MCFIYPYVKNLNLITFYKDYKFVKLLNVKDFLTDPFFSHWPPARVWGVLDKVLYILDAKQTFCETLNITMSLLNLNLNFYFSNIEKLHVLKENYLTFTPPFIFVVDNLPTLNIFLAKLLQHRLVTFDNTHYDKITKHVIINSVFYSIVIINK